MKRALIVGLVALGLVVGLAAALAWALVTTPWPDHDGEVGVTGLGADVEVVRDGDGMPVISAASREDLFVFVAQGYAHAQDRFWQMDVNRHVATGRTAELLGDDGLGTDRFLRTLGWERVAEAEYAALGDDARAVLQAYADGVNAYLDQRRPGQLAIAYRLLDPLGPDQPAPWEPVHSLAFLKVMAWDLRSNLGAEIERAILAAELDTDEIAELFPPYPDDRPVIVPGFDGGDVDGVEPDLAHLRHDDVAAGARRLAARVADVERLTGPTGPGVGSNSWVVAGEHTASGAPLLANDPHLAIGMPSVWYENHLRCDDRADAAACPYDVAGVSLPGVPGVVIGQTETTAWALTNLGADVADLYVERVHPDDPNRVEVDGEWVEVDVRTETLRSADGTTERLEVRTTRNGPIVSDVYGALDAVEPSALPRVGGDPPDGPDGDATGDDPPSSRYALSLRWTALQPGPTFEAIPELNAAGDVDDFRAAAERFAAPAQNLLWADASGTIAYQAPGWLPIRRNHDGAYPVPGWDDAYQWDGFVPFDDLPAETDPDRGWIATANEAVVDPGAFDFPLGVDWARGHRKARIVDLLTAQLGDYDVADAAADQADTFDRSGTDGVPHALAVDAGDDDRVAELQSVLAGWDGHADADADSAGAAAWMATWRHLLAATFHHDLPEAAWPRRHDRYVDVMADLYDRPDADWWNDPTTEQREDRDAILHRAMAAAHDELVDRLGDDPAAWAWGELHTATFRESTLGESGVGPVEALFNRGAWPVGGGFGIVNATGWDAVDGYDVITIPSVRTVVDLADPDRTVRLHAPGQVGHPFHGHSTDLADRWAVAAPRTRPFTPAAVGDAAVSRMLLRPAGS